MKYTLRNLINNHVKPFLIPSLFLLGWYFICSQNYISPASMPSPKEVAKAITTLLTSGHFWKNALDTIYTMLLGVACGALPAFILGLIIGFTKKTRPYFEFSFEFGRALPAVAILSPITLIFGSIGMLPKVAIVSFGIFFLSVIHVMELPNTCSGVRIKHLKLLGARNIDILFKVVIREGLGNLITCMRIIFSIGLILTVVSEMFVGNSGIGYLLFHYKDVFKPDLAWAITFLLGITGYLFNFSFINLQQKVDNWRQ